MSPEFDSNPRFTLARAVILQAGQLAADYFSRFQDLTTETKQNGQDVVSAADREVEDIIRKAILAAFPDDGFLGEEQGMSAGTSGYTWVVDPIDGTSCFVHGLKDWCVSIALMQGETCAFGLIFQPEVDELFTAMAGAGAYLNGQRIQVDENARIDTGLLGLGANFRIPLAEVVCFVDALMQAGGMFIRNGSGALMLAHVACGRLAGYYEPHINSWDCMAALCLIREAGGWTADFPTSGDLMVGGPVIASAPQLRDPLSALVAQSLKGAKE